MFAPLRVSLAILLLGLWTTLAFTAGFDYRDLLLPVDDALISAGDGGSINVLTGAYVPR